MKRDKTVPGRRWKFGKKETAAFEDMLRRSIPQIDVMREACFELGLRHVRPGSSILDIGCSRGDALAPFAERFDKVCDLWGIEASAPMAQAAAKRFEKFKNVRIVHGDVRALGFPGSRPALILAVLTLQFIPINDRQGVLRQLAELLEPGGALLLVEKVLGNSAEIDREMVAVYHEMKARNGYSREEIERKRLSLEGVLVPLTAHWNEELLKGAGFRGVDVFWRWMNFAGWIAVK